MEEGREEELWFLLTGYNSPETKKLAALVPTITSLCALDAFCFGSFEMGEREISIKRGGGRSKKVAAAGSKKGSSEAENEIRRIFSFLLPFLFPGRKRESGSRK